MLTVDYPTFKEIVGKVSFDKRSAVYFYEDTKQFVLFFTDGMWKYSTIVSKDEIKSFVPHSEMDKDYIDFIREFRKRNLDGAIRVLGFDFDITIKNSEGEKTQEETQLVKQEPNSEELPFQTKEPDTLVEEVNKKIKEGEL